MTNIRVQFREIEKSRKMAETMHYLFTFILFCCSIGSLSSLSVCLFSYFIKIYASKTSFVASVHLLAQNSRAKHATHRAAAMEIAKTRNSSHCTRLAAMSEHLHFCSYSFSIPHIYYKFSLPMDLLSAYLLQFFKRKHTHKQHWQHTQCTFVHQIVCCGYAALHGVWAIESHFDRKCSFWTEKYSFHQLIVIRSLFY